jgi:hypothetical protein
MAYKYDPPSFAGPGVMPGTQLLVAELKAEFKIPVGTWALRCIQQCGAPVFVGAHACTRGHTITHHAECTAVDCMTYASSMHAAIISWALGPRGQLHEIQEIVTGYPPMYTGIIGPARWEVGKGWKRYSGGPSLHYDHIHLSQTKRAAGRTALPLPPPLPPPTPPTQEDDEDMPAFPYRLVRSYGSWYTVAVPMSGDPTGIRHIPPVSDPSHDPLANGTRAKMWAPEDEAAARTDGDSSIDLYPELFKALTGLEPGPPRHP